MTAEVDQGPILFQHEIPIADHATSASLAAEVDRAGAAWVPELVFRARRGALPKGYLAAEPGSYFPPLRPEHGLIDWTRTAKEIDRLIRAATGAIHAYTWFRGMRLIALAGRPALDESTAGGAPGPKTAGRVVRIAGGAIHVTTQDGAFAITRWLFLHRAYSGEELARELLIEVGDSFIE
jgi:methionyl-tRNA formyltransferase